VRDLQLLDVSDPGQFSYVGVVGPVPEAGEVTVGAALAVFSAVGCPFICRMPAPGLPSMPRMMLTLFTCTAAAVA
jgi:hypothetical protein